MNEDQKKEILDLIDDLYNDICYADEEGIELWVFANKIHDLRDMVNSVEEPKKIEENS